VRPFLLQYRHKDQVQLVQKRLLGPQGLFGARALNDELNNEVSDTYKPVSVTAPERRENPGRAIRMVLACPP
jgi:hypothetical protein